jgi:hypothetical protein
MPTKIYQPARPLALWSKRCGPKSFPGLSESTLRMDRPHSMRMCRLMPRPNGSATKGHGIGMQNVRDRLAFLYPDSYEFDAVAPTDGGYEVTSQIPYERAIA